MINLVLILSLITVSLASAQTVVCPPSAPANVKLAAKEIRRYVYLRTGKLLPMAEAGNGIVLKIDPSLGVEEYRIDSDGITGGSDVGVLYGTYRYAELLGVRFSIDGDVLPDEPLKELPAVKPETGTPRFALRGLQPFHDFPEGPDWWTTDQWKSILGQATKLRMNFVGLHTYPFHNTTLGPEPLVWVGVPEDVNADGTVKVADYASWYTTAKPMPYGCYAPMKTGDYSFGGAEVFPAEDYGPEINTPEDFPMPKTPAASVAMINRTGAMMKKVFDEAHRLGMKVAVGTEAPLDIPDTARGRLKELGLDEKTPAALQKLYEGMFTRISRAFPIDYYWLWGHEGEIDAKLFVANVQAAHAAMKNVHAPFSVGVCGWGWTAGHFPAFHKVFPNDVFFSAISSSVGRTPISENFSKLGDRPHWAIPWFEDDGHLASLQLRAGRMRRDAVDARRYGCTGLMGILWRTRILSPNIGALAQAGWEQGVWSRPAEADSETLPRDLPVGDFYADWAPAQFGREVGPAAAAIFTKLDGKFPTPSGWIRGPGAIAINKQPWSAVAGQYAFVDQFAALRTQVKGAGSLERFDWWLNTFRVTKSMGQFGCARGELDVIMERIVQQRDAGQQRQLAREQALPVRLRMVTLLGDLHNALLATLHNATELGTLCNIEQQSMHRLKVLTGQDAALEKFLGEALPAAAQPWKDYRGVPRLVVMNARTMARRGETLTLNIIGLGKELPKPVVQVRALGRGKWKELPVTHIARAVFEAKLPVAQEDFEYYVTAGDNLVWPASAPNINQTVVVTE